MNWVHFNGRLLPADAPLWRGDDRGPLLGDGLFETLPACEGRLRFWADHWARLEAGARRLAIPLPWRATEVRGFVAELLEANRLVDGRAAVRMTVTRGPGERGLLPPAAPRPSLLIQARPYTPPDSPARLIVSALRRNPASPLVAVKSLNMLELVLARREAAQRGADDALLLNLEGRVCETTVANIFLVRQGKLLTPPLTEGLLPGVTRAAVLRLARAAGIPALETELTLEDFAAVEEAFITNSLIGVRPIAAVEEIALPAARGEITDRVAEWYNRECGES